jgi:dolichol kinase
LIHNSEFLRKLLHLSNLVIPFTYLFYFDSKVEALIILLPITSFAFLIEYLRINSISVKNIFDKYLFSMLRNHEKSGKYTGATWVFISSTLSIGIFPKDIAIISLIYMSIGDTAAGLIGRKFGRIKIYNKTLEGALAGFIVCLIVGLMIDLNLSKTVVAIGALSAAIIEFMPISIDDNLRIPLFSGTVMYVMSIVLI